MSVRVAFVGFQHGHAFSLYADLNKHPDVEIVAACEEDAGVRAKAQERQVAVAYDNYDRMLAEVACDAVACCDWNGIRAARMIGAMQAGKHVISDKPIATKLEDLAVMRRLAEAKHLSVGCQLPVPDHPPFATAGEALRSGVIGEVHSVTFNGAHALNYEGRPSWMFEPDRYGGSINDIAIHAVDALPWMTGRRFTAITVAREWNARVRSHPGFGDGAVVLFQLDNGGAAYGDVSWLNPDSTSAKIDHYWRFTFMGSSGVIETWWNAQEVLIYRSGAAEVERRPLLSPGPKNYVDDWLADIAKQPDYRRLHTARVLRSAEIALLAQRAAHENQKDVPLP